jgi:hypothetical protein
MSVIITNDVIYEYLCYDVAAIQNQLMGTALLSVIYSKLCIIKEISY